MANFNPFLNTVKILVAHFQSAGTFPYDRDRLNKCAKLPLMAGAPVSLVVLRPLSSFKMSSDVMAENLLFEDMS